MDSSFGVLMMLTNQQFQQDVVRAFRKIMDDHAFIVAFADDCYIRLDSQKVSIHVRYDQHRSYEVDVSFELHGEKSSVRVPFTLGEIYREMKVPSASECSFLQTSEYPKVVSFLNSTCQILQSYCSHILKGDPTAFEAVKNRRTTEAAEYTRHVQFDSVKEKAAKAWSEKKFRDYVDLMRGFYDILSESERKKVFYASSKIGAKRL